VSAPVIVCVDDDAEVASSLARTFKRERLQPMSTTEPEEALEWIVENDVAVLVCDYQMPVMNGIELATRVRDVSPTTVRILLTGNVDVETALASINQGEVYRFVAKPVHLDSLLAVVYKAIDHHRELAAVAAERSRSLLRQRVNAELEARFPTITTPARAHDGAYLVQRRTDDVIRELGLDPLLALRRSRSIDP
jgi:DNA-binding NtrC family response regulator